MASMETRAIVLAAVLWVVGVSPALAQIEATGRQVVILTDNRPVADVLAAGLKSAENIASEVVTPAELPDLFGYRAVLVALDGAIGAATSKVLQAYTHAGGRLILLHHAVAPSQPADWLAFVGVKFASGDVARGGFRAVANAPVELVALSHRNAVIETKVVYDRAVRYASTSRPREMRLPGLAFPVTDVFLNHMHTRVKQPLMGIKVTDPRSGATYMQDTGIWVDELEKGQIYYFMIGQTVSDFRVAPYVQIIANAVVAP